MGVVESWRPQLAIVWHSTLTNTAEAGSFIPLRLRSEFSGVCAPRLQNPGYFALGEPYDRPRELSIDCRRSFNQSALELEGGVHDMAKILK
jgi:hypothetical protein